MIRAGALLLLVAASAQAARPVLAGEQTYAAPGGQILVHYATTGTDAVAPADADADGTPDFVEATAAAAEQALAHYLALGFRRPIADDAIDGDPRIDVYLVDLAQADGHAATDACTAGRCIGHAVAENDFAGYAYPSLAEAIETVVPHELFHLVQYAYSDAQPSMWSEGTAVWAVEHLHGDRNGDFERFLPAYLTKTFRPYERSTGGFGDAYPYGAALWPHHLGPAIVVDTWTRLETSPLLDALDGALVAAGSSLDAAWSTHTRWNARTGRFALDGDGYDRARTWAEAPREAPILDRGTAFVEGLSARYIPLVVDAPALVAVTAPPSIAIAAWLATDDAPLADGTSLVSDGTSLLAEVDAGVYTLVLTGLSPRTLATPVDITLGPIPAPPIDDSGGCRTAPPSNAVCMIAVLMFGLTRRSATTFAGRRRTAHGHDARA